MWCVFAGYRNMFSTHLKLKCFVAGLFINLWRTEREREMTNTCRLLFSSQHMTSFLYTAQIRNSLQFCTCHKWFADAPERRKRAGERERKYKKVDSAAPVPHVELIISNSFSPAISDNLYKITVFTISSRSLSFTHTLSLFLSTYSPFYLNHDNDLLSVYGTARLSSLTLTMLICAIRQAEEIFVCGFNQDPETQNYGKRWYRSHQHDFISCFYVQSEYLCCAQHFMTS